MDWKNYKVNYFMKGNPHIGGEFYSYKIEARSKRQAVDFAKEVYQKEFERGIRNLPPISKMSFTAIERA